MNKKGLALLLSELETFNDSKIGLEQYQTDSELAAEILWDLEMRNEIEGKVIADFGCGNGIFGIGCLILGAEKVYFVDVDKEAIAICRSNVHRIGEMNHSEFNYEIINDDVKNFKEKVDLVIQNPPFGVKKEHADREFLMSAMKRSDSIVSLHKIESKNFIEKFSEDEGWKAQLLKIIKFPLKRIKAYHTKKVHYVDVGVWKLTR